MGFQFDISKIISLYTRYSGIYIYYSISSKVTVSTEQVKMSGENNKILVLKKELMQTLGFEFLLPIGV